MMSCCSLIFSIAAVNRHAEEVETKRFTFLNSRHLQPGKQAFHSYVRVIAAEQQREMFPLLFAFAFVICAAQQNPKQSFFSLLSSQSTVHEGFSL